ncbi:MAG: ABC transporter ATP-binding protein [Pseudomonadales bacterium]|nr:ABC transporter ATP-binding protein [Pseudomonadales bacterium]
MSYIEVNNLWKYYGDQVVLENVNLKVEKGEFITIVGASGCGKSTFLRMLLGQEVATKGAIIHAGKPLAPEPDQHRGIVFQKYSVFPHMTVLKNVILGVEFAQNRWLGKLFGSRKKHAIEKARALIEAVGLSHAENKYPHELSGGMQQRLAIAQSLIKEPKILLLDEPFGALDPGIRSDMHELVLNLWEKTGTTIFMVTHDLKEGFYLGTRLWVFDKLRHDEHAPERFGAGVTYDLPIGQTERKVYETIKSSVHSTNRKAEAA